MNNNLLTDITVFFKFKNIINHDLLEFLKALKGKTLSAEEINEKLQSNNQIQGFLSNIDFKKFSDSFTKLCKVYIEESLDKTQEICFKDVNFSSVKEFTDTIITWLTINNCFVEDMDIRRKFSISTLSNIFNISDEYENGRVVLFLGAGVSKDFGLPLWSDLNTRLIEECIKSLNVSDESKQKIHKQIIKNPPHQIARWIKRTLDGNYESTMQKILYEKVYKSGISHNYIIDSIIKMNNLHAICTYNYDDLLERSSKLFKSISKPTDIYTNKQIPVYHVHGLIPYLGSPSGDMIFSEDEYHQIGKDPYNWSTNIQLTLLRECTCLLIGLSCTDPNLRRILDIVKGEKSGNTYTIQKVNEKIDFDNKEKIDTWIDSKTFDSEEYEDLYLKTIWINKFDEIPIVLENIIEGNV